ncbi:MAG: ChaN family lipoprotein [Planctomycetes bacterium]|nr:ChaN family lipoprotein [Planctomycetota bacterium]
MTPSRVRVDVARHCLSSLLALATCGVVPAQSTKIDIGAIDLDDAEIKRTYTDWLESKGRAPLDYVLATFEHHDVVLLGEHHEVRQNCAFVTALVPRLVKAGVRVLASEFYPSSRQDDLDAIADGRGERFDRDRAIAISREVAWPTWGYVEYLAIVEAVWKANHEERARTAEPRLLRFVGIDSDWKQVALWNETSAAKRAEAFLAREQTMIASVAKHIAPAGDDAPKVLVHCGFAHTVTAQGVRLGTVLRKRYGSRVRQVVLHHEFGSLSKTIETLAGDGRAIGFDVVESPFAHWTDSTQMAFRFVDSFDKLAEGWVVLAPASALRPVHWIPGFVDDPHFADALFVARRRGWVDKDDDIGAADELDAKIRDHFERKANDLDRAARVGGKKQG